MSAPGSENRGGARIGASGGARPEDAGAPGSMTRQDAECECEEALEHMCEYLDSEMNEGELVRLRTHIENCSACQGAILAERSIRVVLRRSCAEVAPTALRLRVLSQITVMRRTTR